MNTSEAHEILCIDRNICVDLNVVKDAYRKSASQWHPDKNKSPDATAKFQQINNAYELLKVLYQDSKETTHTHIIDPDIDYFQKWTKILNKYCSTNYNNHWQNKCTNFL